MMHVHRYQGIDMTGTSSAPIRNGMLPDAGSNGAVASASATGAPTRPLGQCDSVADLARAIGEVSRQYMGRVLKIEVSVDPSRQFIVQVVGEEPKHARSEAPSGARDAEAHKPPRRFLVDEHA